MKKPKWLKKVEPNKPWKYKKVVAGIEIEPYNFHTPFGMDCDKIDEAMDWIDWKMKIDESRRIIKEMRNNYES